MNAVDTNAGSGNVFADLGLPDADDRFAKAELAHEIWALIRSARLTQAQAARRLGVDQPKVSALLRGRLKDFSIERLLRFPNRPPSRETRRPYRWMRSISSSTTSGAIFSRGRAADRKVTPPPPPPPPRSPRRVAGPA